MEGSRALGKVIAMPQAERFRPNHSQFDCCISIYTVVGKALSARPPTDIDHTKRIRRRHWCEDGARALGWVISTPQAERFADNHA